MPDNNFRALFNDTENVRWDSMDRVRTRARRRTLGQAATVAGLVAVALVGGGVAVAQTRPDAGAPPAAVPSISVAPSPSVPPPPSVRPSPPPAATDPGDDKGKVPETPDTPGAESKTPPTAVTPAMMLQPEDVGPDYSAKSTKYLSGDWMFEFDASIGLDCRPSKPTGDEISYREAIISNGDGQESVSVFQRTDLFPADGSAERRLSSIRQRTETCKPGGGAGIRIKSEGFAGDEALLVITTFKSGGTGRHVLVRKGDVVTEIAAERSEWSDEEIRVLAAKASDRI
ncbi:hypothetical protein [Actinoplanes sp. NPDC051859]|uniref:hypothetical protein n=1 Tax=Actinoplanes sp. NPDC051859 TaxID=3363909 RepID=UPI0037908AF6